jgi:GNAT superfamily N-acetyltransferase
VRLDRFDDPAAFARLAVPCLLDREAEHNLLIGIALALAARRPTGPQPYLAVASVSTTPIAVAARTPPRNLILSRGWTEAALELLVEDLGRRGETLPGVLAGREVATAFARRWCRGRALRPYLARAQRVHALDRVLPVPRPAGELVEAQPADRALVAAWCAAFALEAEGAAPVSDPDALVAERMDCGPLAGFALWQVAGRAVSLAGYGGATPNGVRIGPVYTPPACRRRGYASALVADLSAALLARGRRRCFLFTDLANPTANRLYARIGYRPVADVVDLRFAPAGGA